MIKNVLAATTAAALAFAPVAAQAGERASASEVSLAPIIELDRAPAVINVENEELAGGLTPGKAAAIALFLGLIIHEIVTSRGIIH